MRWSHGGRLHVLCMTVCGSPPSSLSVHGLSVCLRVGGGGGGGG